MSTILWPASLPQNLLQDGYSDTYQDNTIRFQPDAGPAYIRRRYTAVATTVTGRLLLTKAQCATLDTFYLSTLEGGALPFEWAHPRTGTTANLQFQSPPKFSVASGELYYVDMALEVLP